MNSTTNATAADSPSSRYYFMIWLALGAAGIFYITIASLAPDALRGAQASGIEATNQQVAALTSTVSSFRTRLDASDSKQQIFANGLDGLRSDVSGFKSRVDDLSKTVETRLSALGGAQTPGAKALAGGTSAPVTTQAIATKPAGALAPQIDGVIMPDDTGAPADPTAVAAIALAAKPAKPAAPPKPYAVDLAMSTSTDALRQIWQLFKDQHADLLAGLTPRSATSGANVRLLAGPFPSQAAASAQCAKLRKEGLACSPTPMAGTPL